MPYPTTLEEKKRKAYHLFATTVADEPDATQHHAKRLVIARQLATMTPVFDAYIQESLRILGYDDDTPYASVEAAITAALPRAVTLYS